jgi:hypothetical protein
MTPLTQTEESATVIWQQELTKLLAKSRIRLRRPLIHMKVIENGNTAMDPSADWLTLKITRDCLTLVATTGVDAELRRYFLAHELGHIEGQHTEITVLGGFGILAGFMALLSLLTPQFQYPWQSYSWYMLAAGALGLAAVIAYSRTMYYEWAADRRGARMTSKADMLKGMVAVLQYRKKEDESYYKNKSDKLSGLGKPRFLKF